jgi:Penicillin-insensitive murein endopeptidase
MRRHDNFPMRWLVAVTLLALASHAGAETRHAKRRAAHAAKKRHRAAHAFETPPVIHGQSIGAPWSGHLRDPAELPAGDGYVIRRPWRAFGTRTTVDFVHDVILDIRARFPDVHVLAIGDLSQKDGGAITEHHSHQSGRDADIGLIYKEQPAGFPKNFVTATDDNLDCAATFALLMDFADTAKFDGGAQMIFLDYNVQGMLYRWAKDAGVDDDKLERLFQYPHRGSTDALVRHIPNHDNHMHVRFKCPSGDDSCE